MIGKTISHYKILEKLGEGGMGVVYKAEDTKLQRTVALKFLPPALTIDPDAKERFIYEARAASALDHQNICTIYEINEADEQTFIAMAHIQGQTLKEKIRSGPLKLDEALDIGIQIAEGLREAHRKGIVHRDIKSANIMVTDDGQAKIMDFGLAKLTGRTNLTKEGTTLGTVGYMSPEQARGEAVDHRTDIWSLGILVYEMVTGRLPFRGDYEQAVVYSILNEEPEPMTALRTGVPMELERIVAKAMAKTPGERYQHVDEIPVDLRAIKMMPSGVSSSYSSMINVSRASASRPTRWKRAIPWALVVLLGITAGVACRRLWGRAPEGSSAVRRLTLRLPDTEPLWLSLGFQEPSMALSPDGTELVYVAYRDGARQLYLREMDQFDARPIPGTEDGRNPIFSPDGEWIAFFTGGKLKKISLSG
ncbi:MAG: serine/threonine-protein kinase [Candidatus Eisenbacteria sp.]|nr:serine/threonine-protein kinase [Candidatus Eisenbacteria bacterium]